MPLRIILLSRNMLSFRRVQGNLGLVGKPHQQHHQKGLICMIEFGRTYRDMVTGFEGVCTGMIEWISGCKQYILSPRAEHAFKKEASSTFFEKQLEEVDAGISDKVEAPVIGEALYFGKECIDKVTRVKGMCIGRYIWLFNCDQYVLEYQPKDDSRETKYNVLDEGRVELVIAPTREVKPEEVKSTRSGGVFLDYPQADTIL